jgi:transposase
MAMGRRQHRERQEDLWVAHTELATAPGHPFYKRLNAVLDAEGFDRFVEDICAKFYAPQFGRPSLTPGIYFRSLLIGYFEGIGAERGIAWRLADSLALRRFVGIALDEDTPDHSTISRTRRLIDLDTHATVFAWVLEVLARRGLIVGKRIAIDATTLEANAAMRSIVRRDTGASYEEFLTGLAKASGIETPTREDLARLDRKRKKRTSNKEWKSPIDEDARIAKMKDGRTHLAHKAEHAVDLDSGAVVAVTLQAADKGDTATMDETLIEAGLAVAELVVHETESHSGDTKVNIHGIEDAGCGQGLSERRGSQAGEELRGAQLHSGEAAEGQAALAGQGRGTASGLRKQTAGARQLRQEFTQTACRTGGTQLCTLLRNRRDAALPSARTREHTQAAVGPCERLQLEPGDASTAGRGHTAGAEKQDGKARSMRFPAACPS